MANYSNAAIVRAIVKMTLHGQLVENVYHLRTKNAGIPDSEIATTVRDKIWRPLSDNFSGDLHCDIITVQEIFPTPTDPYEKVIGETGALEGSAMPSLVAVVVALKTGLGGRRNRGRKYLAGVMESDTANSKLETARLTALQSDATAVNDWFQASNSLSNLVWGVLHRRSGGSPVPLGADSFVPITSAIVRDILYTMRSRIPGHGN